MTCYERIESYLRSNHIPFEVHIHDSAYTAQGVAEHERIPGQRMVKVVMVVADGDLAMLALPTSRRADLARVSELLGAREVRLAEERDLAEAFPDCQIGAMPPFGNLYGLPVYTDRALEREPTIYFQAGDHALAMSLAYDDFRRLAAPVVADFTYERRQPAVPRLVDMTEMGAW